MLVRIEVQKKGGEIDGRFVVLDVGKQMFGEDFSDIWAGVSEIKRIGKGLKMMYPIRHDEIDVALAKAAVELLHMPFPRDSEIEMTNPDKPDHHTLEYARCVCELAPLFQAILPKGR